MSKATVKRARATVARKAPAKASAIKVARKVAPLMSHATLMLLRRSLRRSLKRVEAALAGDV